MASFLFIIRTLLCLGSRGNGASVSLSDAAKGERFEKFFPPARRKFYEVVRVADLAELGEPKVEIVCLAVKIDDGEPPRDHCILVYET
jgi:hypothetical protein